MKVRSDYVSNSSSSSFIFISKSEYYLPNEAIDVETCSVEDVICRACYSMDSCLSVIDDDLFKNRFFDDIFGMSVSPRCVVLHSIPKSLWGKCVEFGMDADDDNLYDINDSGKQFIKDMLIEYFKDILSADVVCYSIPDYDEDTGEFIDESIGYSAYPNDCLYTSSESNH